MSAVPLLEVDEVVAGYGELRVVQGLSFTLAPDEILAIVGANGVGKTTLLNALAGQLRIWSGRVLLNGERLRLRRAHDVVRGGIALVPEGRHVFASLTVEENLRVGAHTRHARRDVEADIERWYSTFPQLQQLRRRPAGQLSGGEQQMLALARALMSRPRVLLLDEPSLGLAPLVVKTIFRTIREINQTRGVTIVLVEQNARAALQLADYGYVLETGALALEGPSAALAAHPRVAATYLGHAVTVDATRDTSGSPGAGRGAI